MNNMPAPLKVVMCSVSDSYSILQPGAVFGALLFVLWHEVLYAIYLYCKHKESVVF